MNVFFQFSKYVRSICFLIVFLFLTSFIFFVKAAPEDWSVREGDTVVNIGDFRLSVTPGKGGQNYVFFENNPKGINGFLSNFYEHSFKYQNYSSGISGNFNSAQQILNFYKIELMINVAKKMDLNSLYCHLHETLALYRDKALSDYNSSMPDYWVDKAWWFVYDLIEMHDRHKSQKDMIFSLFENNFKLGYRNFLKCEYSNILWFKFCTDSNLHEIYIWMALNHCIPILCSDETPKEIVHGDDVLSIPFSAPVIVNVAHCGSKVNHGVFKYLRSFSGNKNLFLYAFKRIN